jgi:hypothetical protein
MSNPVQEAFDTAITAIQNSLMDDANVVRFLTRKGKHVNADKIAFIRDEMARKLRALDFIKTQTGWLKTDECRRQVTPLGRRFVRKESPQ